MISDNSYETFYNGNKVVFRKSRHAFRRQLKYLIGDELLNAIFDKHIKDAVKQKSRFVIKNNDIYIICQPIYEAQQTRIDIITVIRTPKYIDKHPGEIFI